MYFSIYNFVCAIINNKDPYSANDKNSFASNFSVYLIYLITVTVIMTFTEITVHNNITFIQGLVVSGLANLGPRKAMEGYQLTDKIKLIIKLRLFHL